MLAMKGALIWRTLNSNFGQMVNCNCTQGRGSILLVRKLETSGKLLLDVKLEIKSGAP